MDHSPHHDCTAHSGLTERITSTERRLDAHSKEISKLKGKLTAILTALVLNLLGVIASLFVLVTRLKAG